MRKTVKQMLDEVNYDQLVREEIAAELWKAMQTKNISPRALAEVSRMSTGTINNLLSAKGTMPTVNTLIKLFESLGYGLHFITEPLV